MKRFNIMYGIGKAKYVVNFHNGTSKHNDGSDFYNIKIFNNKKKLGEFVRSLIDSGYKEA
jgi:hypothetical protein